uniref:Uncharacterized protein n=1 Tax=Anguilla anguilla TaxID=7936 RepID=A0A0E9QH18_ANGAN
MKAMGFLPSEARPDASLMETPAYILSITEMMG